LQAQGVDNGGAGGVGQQGLPEAEGGQRFAQGGEPVGQRARLAQGEAQGFDAGGEN